MRIAGILFLLTLIACVFVGCQQPPQGLSAADEQAIRMTTDEALQIANSTADWVAYTKTYYTQDAIVNGPNAPAIKGHDAIIAMFKSFPAIKDFKVEFLEIAGAGNIGYVYGTYSMVVTPPGGKPMPDKGKYVEIWKRQADGAWKVAMDTFNSDFPLPAPEPTK
jgi:ketosteroid isomerase-like protein